MPRQPSAEEISQIGRDKRNPDGKKAALKLDAFGDQIDREPIGDEEPDRISQCFGGNRAPRLRQFQQVMPARARPALLRVRFALVLQDHLALFIAHARMPFGRMIEPPPEYQPDKTQHARNDEYPPPAPTS